MRIRFHSRPIPLLVTTLLVVLGVALAQWQTRRAVEKQQVETQLNERALAPEYVLGAAPVSVPEIEYRRVRVHGHFVAAWPLYLDNRPQDGRPGFYVVMPFQIAGSSVNVLVERGWIPLNRTDRSKIFPYTTPAGDIDIVGIARRQIGHVMQLGTPALMRPGAVVQNLDISAFGKRAGLPLQPFVIEQANSADNLHDGLLRDWPKPSSGIERHRGYAFQWYALAVMAFLFFVVTGCRREQN